MEAEGLAQFVGDLVERGEQKLIALLKIEVGNAPSEGAQGPFERNDHLARRQAREAALHGGQLILQRGKVPLARSRRGPFAPQRLHLSGERAKIEAQRVG